MYVYICAWVRALTFRVSWKSRSRGRDYSWILHIRWGIASTNPIRRDCLQIVFTVSRPCIICTWAIAEVKFHGLSKVKTPTYAYPHTHTFTHTHRQRYLYWCVKIGTHASGCRKTFYQRSQWRSQQVGLVDPGLPCFQYMYVI